MGQIPSKYSMEIYDPAGVRLADLTSRASERSLSKSRNEADDISWRLDLMEFEAYCRRANTDAAGILTTGRNEVRIKRGKTYLAGGQLTYWNIRKTGREAYIDIRAAGFLNLLSYRYTSEEFTGVQVAGIPWSLINASQSLPNGNFGITQGLTTSVGTGDKKYDRRTIKEAVKELTESPTKGFDVEITFDKVLNVYNAIGSDRSGEILFEAPGSIIDWSLPNDATGLANEVTGIGSGNGDEAQATYTEGSTDSQVTHALRQKFLQRSSTDNEDGSLTAAVQAELSAWAFPFEVPQITVNGNKAPFITDYGIGDIVRVRLKDSDLAGHIDGAYRIERYELTVDENDDERIKLFLSV